VTINGTVSPGSVTVNNSNGNYTFGGSGSIAGTTSLTKSGSGSLTLSAVNSFTGGVNVSDGTLIVGVNGALPVGAVDITGGEVQLGSSTGAATVTSLAISGNGTLDITNNHLIVDYGSGSDPTSSIAALLKTGFNNGNWNGAGGIVSSAAAINHHYGVGWADSTDPGNPAHLSSGTMEVKYTLLGDANLQGVVNATDFGILASNFGQGDTNWDQGDFLFTSAINATDFSALAANFGQGDNGADVAVSAADIAALDAFAAANGLALPAIGAVPEPATIGLMAVGTIGVLTRRRRHKR
jgi:autotransporter-associated beta strand protein